MKKILCALLALVLCASAALAEIFAEEPTAEATLAAEVTIEPEVLLIPEPTEEMEATSSPEVEETATLQAPETPESTQAPESSDVPALEPEATAAPSLEPDPSVEPSQTPKGGYEGYALVDGQRIEGTLAQLLSELGSGTIYVSKPSASISGFRLSLLGNVEFRPDPEVFSSDCVVSFATDDGPLDPEQVSNSGATVTLTISVVRGGAQEAPTPTENPIEEIQLRVTSQNFSENAWSREVPEFFLEGIPEGAAGYSYAAILYGERIVPLARNVYRVGEEGAYDLRFVILNEQGDVAAASEEYRFMLDFTPPELAVDLSAEQDYTMIIHATDSLSGTAALSLDGGGSWIPIREDENVIVTENQRRIFAAGEIQACDQAGNVASNAAEIELNAIPTAEPAVDVGGAAANHASSGGGSGGRSSGGGGSGGGSSAAKTHASGNGNAAPYGAYQLALPEGPVRILTLGDEAVDLRLEVAGSPARFTAKLTTWAVEVPLAPEITKQDTLVLRAESASGDCRWRINGAVLRKLFNSDIRYLVLAANDALVSLPTVGIAAGTRYAQFKMEGVSNAEFAYEVVMRAGSASGPDWNLSERCMPELWAEVAGERFALIDRYASPEMYPVDVYCGPEELMNYPYGTYPGTREEGLKP